MRKVVLTLKKKQKYQVIKKLVATDGNKERARIKLGLKSIRQINRLIAGYKEYGKEFFVHGNRGRKLAHALSDEQKNQIEDAHPRQPRCFYFGEEVQIDASEHLWFGNVKTFLHATIDDSTGQVIAAYFDNQETLNGYYNIFYQILTKYRHTISF